MELIDTIDEMCSDDYEKRFVAEYEQLTIRIIKLEQLLSNWDNLDFTPKCDRNLLSIQIHRMQQYQFVLKQRAIAEGIALPIVLIKKGR